MSITKVKQIKVGNDIGHSRLTVCECKITVGGLSNKIYFTGFNGLESLEFDMIKFLDGELRVRIFKKMSNLKADTVIEFTDQIWFGKAAASNSIIDEINFFSLCLNDEEWDRKIFSNRSKKN